jgi:hypothetical protein
MLVEHLEEDASAADPPVARRHATSKEVCSLGSLRYGRMKVRALPFPDPSLP